MGKRFDATLPKDERHKYGAHYTPPEFAADVVHKSFEPLFAEHQDTSAFIRSLRVCDMACGDGVFLLESIRYLADRLAKAWEREGVDLGESATKAARFTIAREVVYGVEINPEALEVAKGNVAEFVDEHPDAIGLDDRLKCGDSLVGLDAWQIEALDWDSEHEDMFPALHAYTPLSRDEYGLFGDCVIGAFFAADKDRARRAELASRRPVLLRAAEGDEAALKTAQGWQAELRKTVRPFHWQVEFPEVFSTLPGVPSLWTSFVGNPPFLGGGKISTNYEARYLDWLKYRYPPSGAQCDLVAYFFRRAWELLGRGTMGQIATKTIGQGDTRQNGLQQIVGAGGVIYCADTRIPWPSEASVTVNKIFISKHGTGGFAKAV